MTTIITYFKKHWFALLLLIAGLHITVFRFMGYNLQNVIGDLGDSRFIASIIEYNYQWLTGNYHEYWDGFFMYPDKEVISYSDNLLGITPFYALFRVFGTNMLTAFQLTIILSHTLNFIFCYYCFNRASGNKYGAAAGAFIFAFSIALNGVSNHPQYTFRFCIPLFFYFLFTYLNTQSKRSLLYSMMSLSLQFYLGIYLGYFLLLAGIVFFIAYFIFHFSQIKNVKGIFGPVLLFSPFFIISLLPLFYFYYKRNQSTGYYTDYSYYMETLPRLSSYLKPFPGSVLWHKLNNISANSKYEWFHLLFPGAVVILSVIAGFWFAIKKNKLYLTLMVTLFVIILFTTYYNGHTLYGYVMKIPGIKAARIVTRIITVLLFFGAWLVCLNMNFIYSHTLQFQKSFIILLPFVLLADNYCSPEGFKTYSKAESDRRVDLIKEKILKIPDHTKYPAFAFIHNDNSDIGLSQIDAMLCALTLKTKTVNGYSSSCHRDFGPFWKNMDSVSLAGWCGAMKVSLDSILIVK